MQGPWDHPDWYDLHDTAWSAGSEREPEHYRELVLALPPLGRDDRLVDLGAGTGKLSCLVARAYPDIGQATLVEPNAAKLARALERMTGILGPERVEGIGLGLGEGALTEGSVSPQPNIAIIGNVLMPMLEIRGGTLREGLAWMARVLTEVRGLLVTGGWLYVLEVLAAPWIRGSLDGPTRRLDHLELSRELACAEMADLECVYRFRDRVVVRGRKP